MVEEEDLSEAGGEEAGGEPEMEPESGPEAKSDREPQTGPKVKLEQTQAAPEDPTSTLPAERDAASPEPSETETLVEAEASKRTGDGSLSVEPSQDPLPAVHPEPGPMVEMRGEAPIGVPESNGEPELEAAPQRKGLRGLFHRGGG
jgi:hypothetical protein